MSAASTKPIRTVGAYEAKTKLPELLDQVERGRVIIITRHARNVARLIPDGLPSVDRSVFTRIRTLRAKLTLPKGETTKHLISAGRRI
ncbi:MAG: type II toxin-antitoxin system prevent-host-death family antitoxin [Opitutaceae bacterium]|nr:type II toxin-antitoxin system prevent-host-death family antitoxin [Opitutaceae bacterium]